MTRRGKIARLPDHIREQINSRLNNGEDGKSILSWLNALPEVQTVLSKLFQGCPVNHTNLSDWRSGGYRDWVLRQDTLNFARDLHNQDPQRQSTRSLLQHATIQYAAAIKALLTNELDPKVKWKRLRELSADATHLHRAQATPKRVRLNIPIPPTQPKHRSTEAPKHRNTDPPASGKLRITNPIQAYSNRKKNFSK
jgi:hypothetical protein